MNRMSFVLALATGMSAAAAAPAIAQSITGAAGFYFQGNDFEELREGAETLRVTRDGTLALGFNVQLGALRGSIAYAGESTVGDDEASGDEALGTSSILVGAADLVIRPFPRILFFQPYGIAGGGLKRFDYSWERDRVSDAFPDDDTDWTLHAGAGVDMALGPLGVMLEVTDYISRDDSGGFSQHDAFAMIGVRLGTF